MESAAAISKLIKHPEDFIQRNSDAASKLQTHLKYVYDFLKSSETPSTSTSKTLENRAMGKLFVDGFDSEQIWQQLELQNGSQMNALRRLFSTFGNSTEEVAHWILSLEEDTKDHKGSGFEETNENPEDEDEQNSEADEENMDAEDDDNLAPDSPDEGEMEHSTVAKKPHVKSIVDDQFFNLHAMNEFLQNEDRKHERNQMEDLDWDAVEDDTESAQYRYDEFFDPPEAGDSSGNKRGKKTVRFQERNESESDEENDEEDENESEADDVNKSEYEQRQKRLAEKMANFEEENVGGRSWQLMGEATAKTRPENSLLEEHVGFDHTTKAPPVITQETTKKLEDIIMQRIIDKAFDDVERKVKPVAEPYKYKNELILDQQKSKQSLSAVYEEEYLRKTELEKTEAANSAHEEIRKMLKDLFFKLDALSNYHYNPKPPVPEIKIVSNMPTIAMEEPAPVTVSNAALLAPEEIKEKSKFAPKADDEMTASDKLRRRKRTKKLKRLRMQRKDGKEKTDKVEELRKIGKVKKAKMDSETAQKNFFSKLQSEVQSEISKKSDGSLTKRKTKKLSKNANNFKL